MKHGETQIAVVGAGHAGIEAALAAARMGLDTVLFTMNLDAVMHGLKDIDYTGYFTFEVGGIFRSPKERRPFPADERLLKAPLSLKCAAEAYLYELGKCVLETYGCFEE